MNMFVSTDVGSSSDEAAAVVGCYKRSGVRFLYELLPGENFFAWGDYVVVTHPEHPPKIVHEDGTIEELKL